MIEWEQVVGHDKINDYYGASAIMGNYLIVAYNTNHSHKPIPLENVSDIEFAVLRLETGEGVLSGCQMVLTHNSGSLKAHDLIIAGETGMYLYAEVQPGDVTYIYSSSLYNFTDDSYAIFLFCVNTSQGTGIPNLNLLDVESHSKSSKEILYPLTRLFAYYSSGLDGYGVPELVFLSNINPSTNSGLIVYNFSSVTANSTTLFPESHNPFITASNCTATNCDRCFIANTKLCVQCATTSSYYLNKQFICTPSACSSGYYIKDNAVCKQCHSSCQTCNGPLSTQCLTCDSTRVYQPLTKECKCGPTNPYIVNGQCTSSCLTGQSGYMQSGICKNTCPPHTFYYSDYSSLAPVIKTPGIGVGEGSDLLQFTIDSTNCLQLPGPNDATSIPSAFTVTFWIRMTTLSSGTLIWGFNSFAFRATNGFIQLQLNQSTTIISLATPYAILTPNTWIFVAGSVKAELSSYTILLYAVQQGQAIQPETRLTGTILTFPTYTNSLFVGCQGTFTGSGNLIPIPGISFNGNMRELVYMKKFHDVNSLDDGKTRVYSSCLQIYKDVLAYWRFDTLTSTGSGYLLKDSSIYSQQVITSSNPTKSSNSASISSSAWDSLGLCVDLFNSEEFPKYSISIDQYPITGLQYRININSASVLTTILSSNDILLFYFGGCVTGTELLRLSVGLLSSGKIQVQTGLSLPNTVYGRHVDVCYQSGTLERTLKLGQLYVPNIPNHVFPSNGASDTFSPLPITFSLSGGDQSIGDVITLYSIETNVLTATKDSVLVDETLLTYSISTITLANTNSGPKYTTLLSTNVDPGSYTLLWRPSYVVYQTTSDLNEYKNLFTTWSIQQAPRVKFPDVPSVANLVDNGGFFKAGLMYLNITGPGQTDGDQLIFCYFGCNFLNSKGPVYTRFNGQYPGIWLGEEYGVHNLLDQINYDRVYICWRPAARSAIQPQDDIWSTVYQEAEGKQINGYIRINLLLANKDIAEIGEINPPINYPILLQGQSIWFKISKCSTTKMKPSSSDSSPGKVQLVHVKFSSFNHSSYESEVIWEQLFIQLPDNTNNGFTVGDLQGDPFTCNYTLKNVPENMMLPGHTYQLIIYSLSFKSAYSSDYLFGNLDPGLQTFIYWFQYQETIFDIKEKSYIPSQSQIEISGSNFGDIVVEGSGITEVHRMFGITFNLTCGNIIIPSSYLIRNLYLDNPSSIVITDLNLQSCNSTLDIEIKINKIGQNDAFPIWTCSQTTTKISLGNISCDPSCLTCNGPSVNDCLSCNSDGNLNYLLEGQCKSQCNQKLPYSQIISSPGQTDILYFKCVSKCFSGYYLNEDLNICMKCNRECKSCTSGRPNSCTDCQSYPIFVSGSKTNDINVYTQFFFFKNMCLTSCPVFKNDYSKSATNVIIARDDLHLCYLGVLPNNSHPISVALQQPFYPDKLDVKLNVILRAIINDPTHNLTLISWTSFPEEDMTNSSFFTSEERVFQSYDSTVLNSSTISLNMNLFNYRGDFNQLCIFVKAYTCDSFAFDVFQLFGNSPPDVSGNITFPDNTIFSTLSTISLSLSGIKDANDIIPIIKFKVILQPISLVIPPNVSSLTPTPLNALQILATLPKTTILLTSAKVINLQNNSINIANIYIPTLTNGPQTISGLTIDKISCDLYIYCEDRQLGLTTVKQTINITETFKPQNRSRLLESIYKSTVNSSANFSMNWDIALSISQSFKIANPSIPTATFSACSRDLQCNQHGKCVSSGGYSECICEMGYEGSTCNWTQSDLKYAKEIGKSVIIFLNNTILAPIGNTLYTNADFLVNDADLVYQIGSVLTGLLQNPEVGDPSFNMIVSQLCIFMTSIDPATGGRLMDFQKSTIISAIDVAIQFIFFHIKDELSNFFILNENASLLNPVFAANFTEARNKLVNLIMPIRTGLYNFLNRISISQYPGGTAFTQKGNSFEVFLTSERVDELFAYYGKEFAIKPSITFGAIKFPPTVVESLKANITTKGEFKIRLVQWFQDPFIFSNYHSVVCTNVLSMALLDSNGTELSLNLSDPIIMLLPIINISMNYPTDYVKCMYFNNSNKENVTSRIPFKINVNTLNLTNSEKLRLYPQWNPVTYLKNNLIVEDYAYKQSISDYPEYTDSDGISSYGNILKLNEYNGTIPCALFHLGEVAGIIQRKKANQYPEQMIGFYGEYVVDMNLDTSLGIYVCIVVASMFCFFYLLSCIIDVILVPRVEKIMEINREEYSIADDKDFPNAQSQFLFTEKIVTKEETDLMESKKNAKIVRKSKRGKRDAKNLKNAVDNSVSYNTIEVNNAANVNESKNGTENAIPTTQSPVTFNDLTTCAAMGKSLNHLKILQITEKQKKLSNNENKVDIFSMEYKAQKEINQFKFCNIFLISNILLNWVTITNTLFFRTSRTILIFLNVMIHFNFTFIFICSYFNALDCPETTERNYWLNSFIYLWIPFFTPLPATMFQYAFGLLFKIPIRKVLNAKSLTIHRKYM